MYLFTKVVDVFLKKFYFQAPKYLTIPTNLIFATTQHILTTLLSGLPLASSGSASDLPAARQPSADEAVQLDPEPEPAVVIPRSRPVIVRQPGVNTITGVCTRVSVTAPHFLLLPAPEHRHPVEHVAGHHPHARLEH